MAPVQRRMLIRNRPRIRAIREVFPNAKFIHMIRNPYEYGPGLIETVEGRWGHWVNKWGYARPVE